MVVSQMTYFADHWETLLSPMAKPQDFFHPAHLEVFRPR